LLQGFFFFEQPRFSRRNFNIRLKKPLESGLNLILLVIMRELPHLSLIVAGWWDSAGVENGTSGLKKRLD
jgi:hypothetical protein